MKQYLVPCAVFTLMVGAPLGVAQEVDLGPPGQPGAPVYEVDPVFEAALDRCGLSFSNQQFISAHSAEPGTPVTVYVLASLASPSEGVTSFSCRVAWNDEAIKDLVWQAPVTIENDGVLAATFAEILQPIDGHIVLATATGQASGADCAAVRITNTPVVVGTLALDRTVPVADQIGETLALNCAEDLGPPGAPGTVTIIPD